MNIASQSMEFERPELFFALVAPVGAKLDELSRVIQRELDTFGYVSTEIRLSGLLRNFQEYVNQPDADEFNRIKYLQKLGNDFCRTLKDRSAIARAALTEIREKRKLLSGHPDKPARAHAFILNQLKRPEEVDFLRQVYGTSFYLIGGHAPEQLCESELALRNARKLGRIDQHRLFIPGANEVMQSDEKQDDEYGQNTRDTYPKADFMADLATEVGREDGVRRFIQLLFGHPFKVPTAAEYAMYQASAVSLRSSDENRQVGAAIVNLRTDPKDTARITGAELIAVGMNEVPRAGGAPYYDDCSPDARDQVLQGNNDDRANDLKASALSELIEKFQHRGFIDKRRSVQELAREILPTLNGTQFMNMGEFSRPVHAEMAALIDAARRGVSVDGRFMFVTTFPCHNCAKHIIAAGISKVIYLEPYPKSRAKTLYNEELDLDGSEDRVIPGKVVFRSFSGVAPRQYARLFSMSERGKKSGRTLRTWEAGRSMLGPAYVARNAAAAYLLSEREELQKLLPQSYKWDRALLETEAQSGGADKVGPQLTAR